MINGVLICTLSGLFHSMKPQSTCLVLIMKNNTTLWSLPRLLTFTYIVSMLYVGYSYKEIHVVLKMYPELLHIQNTSRVCVLGISVAYF